VRLVDRADGANGDRRFHPVRVLGLDEEHLRHTVIGMLVERPG
jgi:hypothetical protein